MALTVVPTVVIDGAEIACTVEALDTAPTAIRGFTIEWGREEYLTADTSPASVNLSITDATDHWAERIRDRRAVGVTVEITWTGHPDHPGVPVGPVTMFKGRIQNAEAAPMGDLHTVDGRRRWEITLTVADRTADYGNGLAGPADWGVESMLSRAVKVRDLGRAAGSGIEQVYFWPGYQRSNCSPLEVKNKSALDLLGELYASMGNDSYAYDPDENVIRQAIRLSQPLQIHLGAFDDDRGAVYPVAGDITVDNVTYPGISLGGCELIGEPAVTADPSTAINRLECTWSDWSLDYDDTTTVRDLVRAGDSRRTMAWESWLNAGESIDPTLDNVWDRVREEGSRPRHPDIQTRPTHSFVTGRMARWVLQTWENTRPAYIAGSLAYEWLLGDAAGYSPVVAPIGGETFYEPETGWSAALHVHWIHNSATAGAAASWSSLQQVRMTYERPSSPWWYPLLGIPAPEPVAVGESTPERDLTWGEAAGEGYRFANSVTWGDMRHVPDTGTQIIDHLE